MGMTEIHLVITTAPAAQGSVQLGLLVRAHGDPLAGRRSGQQRQRVQPGVLGEHLHGGGRDDAGDEGEAAPEDVLDEHGVGVGVDGPVLVESLVEERDPTGGS